MTENSELNQAEEATKEGAKKLANAAIEAAFRAARYGAWGFELKGYADNPPEGIDPDEAREAQGACEEASQALMRTAATAWGGGWHYLLHGADDGYEEIHADLAKFEKEAIDAILDVSNAMPEGLR